MNLKKAIILFIVLTVVNGIIFIYRDHFTYTRYSTYNELYSACNNSACFEKWEQFIEPYPKAELNEARQILSSLNFTDSTTDLSKALAIASHLYTKFNTQMGVPSFDDQKSSPIKYYKRLGSNKNDQLWCGNFGQFFTYFCLAENIPCRYIEIFKPNDNHVINECFIKELGKWVLVDVTSNLLLARGTDGAYLDLQEFLKKLESNKPINIFTVQDNAVATVPLLQKIPDITHYYKSIYPYYYYYLVETSDIYTPLEKLKRYIYPVSWYEIYSEEQKGNTLFFLKLTLLLVWSILLFYIFIQLLQRND